MKNYSQYIGIPFTDKGRDMSGMDCLGLVLYFYNKEFGVKLPDDVDGYDEAYARHSVGGYIYEYGKKDEITEVDKEDIKKYDVLVFAIGKVEFHVAIAINSFEMLHIIEGSHSVIERYDSPKWKKRLSRVYRYGYRQAVIS